MISTLLDSTVPRNHFPGVRSNTCQVSCCTSSKTSEESPVSQEGVWHHPILPVTRTLVLLFFTGIPRHPPTFATSVAMGSLCWGITAPQAAAGWRKFFLGGEYYRGPFLAFLQPVLLNLQKHILRHLLLWHRWTGRWNQLSGSEATGGKGS